MERGLGENLFYKKGFHQNCKLCKAKRATQKQVLRKQNEPDQQKTDSRRGLLKSAWGGALFLGILRILRILSIYRCAAVILRWFGFLNSMPLRVGVPYTTQPSALNGYGRDVVCTDKYGVVQSCTESLLGTLFGWARLFSATKPLLRRALENSADCSFFFAFSLKFSGFRVIFLV